MSSSGVRAGRARDSRVVSRRARPVRPTPRARLNVRASSSRNDSSDRGFGLLEWLGPVVPQGALVTGVKTGWREAHRAMVRELAPQSPEGAYVRPAYAFDGVISPTPGVAGDAHPPEPDRYVVYVGNACPWCHRVTLTIALKGLGDVVRVARMTDDAERASRGGWVFERGAPESRDPVFDAPDLRVVYDRATAGRPEFPDGYRGRCTAPLLLDAVTRRPVSNESADIVRMLGAADFRSFGASGSASETDEAAGRVRLYPAHLAEDIDDWNARTYSGVNDGVYRCGFATSQAAYERAASSGVDARRARRAIGDAAVSVRGEGDRGGRASVPDHRATRRGVRHAVQVSEETRGGFTASARVDAGRVPHPGRRRDGGRARVPRVVLRPALPAQPGRNRPDGTAREKSRFR